jgi:two-component system capsular synthesis sensor histidine kinase RcsC
VTPDPARPSILVAEDNEISRELLRLQLDRLGCDVVVARDGAEAAAAWRAGSFAMLFTDLQMPALDGYGLARLIRAEEGAVALPIVALTADAAGAEIELCGAAGMNECVVKPVSLTVLRGVLDRWCGTGAFAAPWAADDAQRAMQRR